MKLSKRFRDAFRALFGMGGGSFYYSGYGQEGVPVSGRGFDDLMAANIQHVARCINLLKTACAATHLRLYAKTKTAGPKRLNFPHRKISEAKKEFIFEYHKSWAAGSADIEEIIAHPIFDVLRNINNGNDNPMDFFSYIISQHGLVGNSFVQKNRGFGGLPIGLNISDPARWSIVPGENGMIKQYEYRAGAKKQIYFPEDILHFKNPDPRGGYMGVGVLMGCFDSYDTDMSIRKFERATFDKGGAVAGIFNIDKDYEASPEEIQATTDKLRQKFTGRNAERIAVLQGIQYQAISQTLRELNHIQGRQLTRNEIYNAFDVPIAFADLNNANLASAREARAMLAELGVLPRLRMIEEELNADLVSEFDENLILVFDSPMPNDAVEERKDDIAYLDRGVYTRNEVRARKGLDPIDYDETFPGERAGGSSFEPTPTEGTDVEDEEAKSKSIDEAKISRAEHWKAFDRRLRRHEIIIEKKARELLNKMWDEVLNNMSGKKGVDLGEIDSWLYDQEEFDAMFGDELYPPVEATFIAGANAQGVIDFDLNSPRATDELGKMKNRIRDIPNDRWEKIRGELIDGMENGETLTELRNRVMEARGNDNKYGAERIARTETAGAYNAGHHEATMQDPLSWGSEWITTIDDRTRETHEGLDGERRQKGERFSNGLMYPGESSGEAEEVINCRCTIRAVEKEAA